MTTVKFKWARERFSIGGTSSRFYGHTTLLLLRPFLPLLGVVVASLKSCRSEGVGLRSSPSRRSASLTALSRPLDLAGDAEDRRHMELSLDAYRLVVKQVESKSDLSTLCRVNKGFQRAAERELYNTIHASNAWESYRMCVLFSKTRRLAAIVEDLTLVVGAEDDDDSEPPSKVRLPNDFWPTVSRALHQTTGLRCLNLQFESVGDTAQAWILNGTVFRLSRFHCDLQWDTDLVSFLNAQPGIDDLYIVDYYWPEDAAQASRSASSSLAPGALPDLSTLQCTFAEAACALVPTRPVSRLKTCFSKTRLQEKREELSLLFSKLMETKRPLRSLDIADSTYSDSFCMELLASVTKLQNQVHDLRYLGTLVLPVNAQVRLRFYGLLRILRSLRCVEVDVSEWDPPPPIPTGMRALAGELRLYCPSLQRMIFVNDFERTVIAVARGTFAIDSDSNADNIWREF